MFKIKNKISKWLYIDRTEQKTFIVIKPKY